jgi:hypothetical protein
MAQKLETAQKQVAVTLQGTQYQRKDAIRVEEQTALMNLDYEVKINERDNGLTVFDLLRRIPGLKVTSDANGYSIAFLGNNTNVGGSGDSTPALDIDGQFSDNAQFVLETIGSLSVRQIKKIGVVKYGNSAAYGARGSKGIIVIQTVK